MFHEKKPWAQLSYIHQLHAKPQLLVYAMALHEHYEHFVSSIRCYSGCLCNHLKWNSSHRIQHKFWVYWFMKSPAALNSCFAILRQKAVTLITDLYPHWRGKRYDLLGFAANRIPMSSNFSSASIYFQDFLPALILYNIILLCILWVIVLCSIVLQGTSYKTFCGIFSIKKVVQRRHIWIIFIIFHNTEQYLYTSQGQLNAKQAMLSR